MNPTLQIIGGILAGAIFTWIAYIAYRILANGRANKDRYDRQEETAFRNQKYYNPKK